MHSIEPQKGPLRSRRTPLPSPGTACQEMEENGARKRKKKLEAKQKMTELGMSERLCVM